MCERKSELVGTVGGGGDGSTGDKHPCGVGIDFRYHPLKEEPEPGLGCGSGDDVDGYYYCDPLKEEPELELAATYGGSGGDDCDPLKLEPELHPPGDGAVPDGARDPDHECSHCGVSMCTQEFKVEHELGCEVRMQQSERPVLTGRDFKGPYFECERCEYVTKRKQSLERHLLKHSKNNAEWFNCTQCSYETVHKSNMTSHMKIHGNDFSCCCPVCGKSFKRKQGLDDHLLRHHSDESDKVFKLITSKIYTCNICDKYRTVMKTDLNEHLTVTHLKGVGRQKYQCPRCPHSTFRKGDSVRHSKTHLEQKDYRCTACKKQFTLKQGLDSHVLSNHADNVDLAKTITSKIHRCELCSFRTVAINKLKSHVRSKHLNC